MVLWFIFRVTLLASVLSLVQCSFHYNPQRNRRNLKDSTYTSIIVFNVDEQTWQVPDYKAIGFPRYRCLSKSLNLNTLEINLPLDFTALFWCLCPSPKYVTKMSKYVDISVGFEWPLIFQ